MATAIKMIIGLGNPGAEYKRARHNVGFMVVDFIGRRLNARWLRRRRFNGAIGRAECPEGQKLVLVKPLRYMNRSGEVVAAAANFYRVPLGGLLVVLDDVALEPGRIRLRPGGSAGGHKGLADIVEKLGSGEFARLRVGVGVAGQAATSEYVLGEPSAEQWQLVEPALDRAAEAALCWLRYGAQAAMSQFNN